MLRIRKITILKYTTSAILISFIIRVADIIDFIGYSILLVLSILLIANEYIRKDIKLLNHYAIKQLLIFITIASSMVIIGIYNWKESAYYYFYSRVLNLLFLVGIV
jgi:hypothetical protein